MRIVPLCHYDLAQPATLSLYNIIRIEYYILSPSDSRLTVIEADHVYIHDDYHCWSAVALQTWLVILSFIVLKRIYYFRQSFVLFVIFRAILIPIQCV